MDAYVSIWFGMYFIRFNLSFIKLTIYQKCTASTWWCPFLAHRSRNPTAILFATAFIPESAPSNFADFYTVYLFDVDHSPSVSECAVESISRHFYIILGSQEPDSLSASSQQEPSVILLHLPSSFSHLCSFCAVFPACIFRNRTNSRPLLVPFFKPFSLAASHWQPLLTFISTHIFWKPNRHSLYSYLWLLFKHDSESRTCHLRLSDPQWLFQFRRRRLKSRCRHGPVAKVNRPCHRLPVGQHVPHLVILS